VQLPDWVQAFNAQKRPEQYVSGKWEKLPGKDYSQSFSDWKEHEDAKYFTQFTGEMPYDLGAIRQKTGSVSVIRFTPFGNTLTLDFALEAIEKMQLGADETPDFLCLSFSCTDYIGHQFGIHAEETQDAYLRLDQDIERLLNYLDQHFGKDQVLVFLTADHGGAETPEHLAELRIPTGIFEESKLEDNLEKVLAAGFGAAGNYIQAIANQQIWLNWDALADYNLEPADAAAMITEFLRAQPGVYDVFSRDELEHLPAEYPFAPELRRGVHPRRSGDLLYQLDPAWHSDDKYFGEGGTTHGSSYPYDTHVPLVWYGWKVPKGVSYEAVSITDIAPTLAAMLRIMEPNGCTGKVIQSVMR
jgi:predicted AlkP superfamily pyrophosphatase or phosphodiesterase